MFLRFSSAVFVSLVLVGCGNAAAPSPFAASDAGADASDAASDGNVLFPVRFPEGGADSGSDEWGAACAENADCDDGADCTEDECDPTLKRCHFIPDDAPCDDGAYCDGVEQCVPRLGCQAGQPVSCSDGTACTIDACDETTHQCSHVSRDADGDGDPDGNCPGGHDCNDQDPNVSSLHVEICNNGIDDNCNGQIDEPGCVDPSYDVCTDPLDVSASGAFQLSAAAAHLDYAASCVKTDTTWRDLVVAIHVPEGGPADVDLAVTSTSGSVGLASASQCGDAASVDGCAAGASVSGENVSRLILRSVAPGAYAVYVFTNSTAPVTLNVDYSSPAPAPPNETCGTAQPITSGVHVDANVTGTTVDLKSACTGAFGDLVYEFDLAQASDVNVFATPKDSYGTPILSLFDGACGAANEVTCRNETNADLFVRALPAGHYYAGVASTGPSDMDVVLDVSPKTTAAADENCVGSPALSPFVTTNVDLSTHVDDIHDGCSVGTPDAAYALELAAASDVLLVESFSDVDEGSVSLASPTCPAGHNLSCNSSDDSPVRTALHGVSPGEYRAVVESELGDPVTLTALVRAATAPVLVPFSDACGAETEIPDTGGFFEGNTANAANDYTASCDVGGTRGAPDQLLHLKLTAPRRVVLDARGSQYDTLLDVRTGSTCPGDEVEGGCSAGDEPDRSYVDLSLPAGDYWIQMDGYEGDSGPWDLDVFVGGD